MFWRGGRESGNIEDRRGFGGKSLGAGGLLIGAFVVYLMGGNPLDYLSRNATTVTTSPMRANNQQEGERKSFAAVVLGYTEDVWGEKFSQSGARYRAPKMVLFSQRVDSACGSATSATGPFYCPADEKVYLDLSFFDDLSRKLGAEGDAAAAYVIAHEVGHHVQNLLGVHEAAHERQRAQPGERNRISVATELQADCFAGLWAKHIETRERVIEPGDIQEAMGAASAVGDDRLQKRSRGYAVPDSFTHGSSAQRVAAFRAGYESGEMSACQN